MPAEQVITTVTFAILNDGKNLQIDCNGSIGGMQMLRELCSMSAATLGNYMVDLTDKPAGPVTIEFTITQLEPGRVEHRIAGRDDSGPWTAAECLTVARQYLDNLDGELDADAEPLVIGGPENVVGDTSLLPGAVAWAQQMISDLEGPVPPFFRHPVCTIRGYGNGQVAVSLDGVENPGEQELLMAAVSILAAVTDFGPHYPPADDEMDEADDAYEVILQGSDSEGEPVFWLSGFGDLLPHSLQWAEDNQQYAVDGLGADLPATIIAYTQDQETGEMYVQFSHTDSPTDDDYSLAWAMIHQAASRAGRINDSIADGDCCCADCLLGDEDTMQISTYLTNNGQTVLSEFEGYHDVLSDGLFWAESTVARIGNVEPPMLETQITVHRFSDGTVGVNMSHAQSPSDAELMFAAMMIVATADQMGADDEFDQLWLRASHKGDGYVHEIGNRRLIPAALGWAIDNSRYMATKLNLDDLENITVVITRSDDGTVDVSFPHTDEPTDADYKQALAAIYLAGRKFADIPGLDDE